MPICETCSTKWGLNDKKPCYFCINKGISLTFLKRDYSCDMCQSSYSWLYYKKLDMCDSCKEEECKKIKPLNIITSKFASKSRPNVTCKDCDKKCFNQEALNHHINKNCPKTNYIQNPCNLNSNSKGILSCPDENYDWRKADKDFIELSNKSKQVEHNSMNIENIKTTVSTLKTNLDKNDKDISEIKDMTVSLVEDISSIKEGHSEYLEKMSELETKVDGNTINCEEVIKSMEDLDVKFNNTSHKKITVVDLFADNIVSKNSVVYSEPPKKPNRRKRK